MTTNLFVIKRNNAYFGWFINGGVVMFVDIAHAAQMSREEALKVKDRIGKLEFINSLI